MAKQLLPVPFITPAFQGLNKAKSASTTLGPEWALELQNVVFDQSGRIASRSGWVDQAVTPIASSPAIVAAAEFIKADGTVAMVGAANSKLYSGITAFTDITGTLAPASNNWQFQNFNDILYMTYPGKTICQWTGAGNATVVAVSSGTAPTGGAFVAAFGRLWGVDADNNTIKYCGLLDATNWGSAGSGSINMRSIWTKGTDQVVGLAAFGATLVVFGKRHIVLFTDGRGSTLGLDPAQMYVVDTIEGTGLSARDSVQNIGEGDVLYLSPTGVQSLARTIQNKTNPLSTVDGQVKDYVQSFLDNETPANIRSAYFVKAQFYCLILPGSGRCFIYNTKFPMQDGSLRAAEWNHIAPSTAVNRVNNTVLFGMNGRYGLYSGFSDNNTPYRLAYSSPNVFLTTETEARLKLLKRIGSIVFTSKTNNVVFEWGFDFKGFTHSLTRSVQGGLTPEYSTAEYGTNGKYSTVDPTAVAGVNYAEYGGGLALRILSVPGSGSGRWIQVGINADINGSELAIQQLDLYCKIAGMV